MRRIVEHHGSNVQSDRVIPPLVPHNLCDELGSAPTELHKPVVDTDFNVAQCATRQDLQVDQVARSPRLDAFVVTQKVDTLLDTGEGGLSGQSRNGTEQCPRTDRQDKRPGYKD